MLQFTCCCFQMFSVQCREIVKWYIATLYQDSCAISTVILGNKNAQGKILCLCFVVLFQFLFIVTNLEAVGRWYQTEEISSLFIFHLTSRPFHINLVVQYIQRKLQCSSVLKPLHLLLLSGPIYK